MTQATIEIKARDVDHLGEFAQHMYIVYTNEAGEQFSISGFPKFSNVINGTVPMLIGEIYVEQAKYHSKFSKDYPQNGETHPSHILFSGTDAEMMAKVELMFAEMERINSEGYDYNIPITETLLPDSRWVTLNEQNSNTVAMHLAKAAGLGVGVSEFVDLYGLNVPGYLAEFEHTEFEKDAAELIAEIQIRAAQLELAGEAATEFIEYAKYILDEGNKYCVANENISENTESAIARLLTIGQSRPTDPLILDLDGDGLELTSLTESNSMFDIDGDGIKEETSWISGDDGILVYDRNNNGVVDDIYELFGKDIDGISKTGTEELAEYDDNGDGIIDSLDSIFTDLQIWQDLNGDGISDAGELTTLSDHQIAAISVTNLADGDDSDSDDSGVVDSTTTYTKEDGSKGTVGNLFVAVNQINSLYDGEYDLTLEIISMPLSRGYGDLLPFHIALSNDSELLEQMQEITNLSINNLSDLDNKVTEFLYQWAGASNLTGEIGGFDVRKLSVLEAIVGTTYEALTGSTTINDNRADILEDIWSDFHTEIKTKITLNTIFSNTLGNLSNYDLTTDTFIFNIANEATIWNSIKEEFTSITDQTEQLYYVYHLQSVYNQTYSLQETDDENIISDKFKQELGISIEEIVFGSDSNDTITLGDNDTLIFAKHGNDNIEGRSTDDSFVGGLGDDYLSGQKGDDIYFYNLGDGKDTINEYGSGTLYDQSYGSDTIKLGNDIASSDVYYSRSGANLYLNFYNNQNDQITIEQYFEGQAYKIETIEFADGTQLTLDANISYHYFGTASNNDIYGFSTNDLIYGLEGDDRLSGQKGDDIYFYNLGDGKDIINEYGSGTLYDQSYGSDTIKLGNDIASSDVYFSRSGADLYVNFYNNLDDKITIEQYFEGQAYKIETIEFADGTQLTLDANISYHYFGTASNNDIYGFSTNDLIYGLEGDDFLAAKGGNDTYIYDLGDGNDTINEYGSFSSYNDDLDYGVDTIKLGEGIFQNDVYLERYSSDLYIKFKNNANDSIKIKYHFEGTTNIIENLKFSDGSIIDLTSNEAINGTPILTLGNVTTNEDQFLDVDIISTVFDSNGEEIFIEDFSQGQSGTVALIDNKLRYIPNSNFYGTDQFNYSIRDASGVIVTSSILIDVLSDNIDEISRNIEKTKHLKPNEKINLSLKKYLKNFDSDSTIFRFETDEGASLPEWLTLENNNLIGTAPKQAQDLVLKIIATDQYGNETNINLNYSLYETMITGSKNKEIIYAGESDDYITTHKNKDIVYAGAGDDYIKGGKGNDRLYGEDGNDTLRGNKGDDKLYGGNGNDILIGGPGNDKLKGGHGDDILIGGAGFDILEGGVGNDIFDFTGLDKYANKETDTIQDYEHNIDLIALADRVFSNLTIIHDENNTIIEDNLSDFSIEISGIFNLSENDFIFS